jgi:hypothetical protein
MNVLDTLRKPVLNTGRFANSGATRILLFGTNYLCLFAIRAEQGQSLVSKPLGANALHAAYVFTMANVPLDPFQINNRT